MGTAFWPKNLLHKIGCFEPYRSIYVSLIVPCVLCARSFLPVSTKSVPPSSQLSRHLHRPDISYKLDCSAPINDLIGWCDYWTFTLYFYPLLDSDEQTPTESSTRIPPDRFDRSKSEGPWAPPRLHDTTIVDKTGSFGSVDIQPTPSARLDIGDYKSGQKPGTIFLYSPTYSTFILRNRGVQFTHFSHQTHWLDLAKSPFLRVDIILV